MNDVEDLMDDCLLVRSSTLARQYDDLRVRLIVLNAARDKDVQLIEEVADQLAQIRGASQVATV